MTQLKTTTSKILFQLISREADDEPPLLTGDWEVRVLGIVSIPLATPLLTEGIELVALDSAVIDAMALGL